MFFADKKKRDKLEILLRLNSSEFDRLDYLSFSSTRGGDSEKISLSFRTHESFVKYVIA